MKLNLAGIVSISTLALVSLGGCSAESGDGVQEGAAEGPVAQTSQALDLLRWFRLKNRDTTYGTFCLGVKAANTASGTDLITWACDGSDNQKWRLGAPIPDNSAAYQLITNVLPGNQRCMASDGWSNGDHVRSSYCGSAWYEGWTMKAVPGWGTDCYKLVLDNSSGKILSTLNGNPSHPTSAGALGIWDDVGHADQVWCAEQM